MTIARVTEVTSSSKNSFEDAVRNGVERASKTLKNVSSAWVKDQDVSVKNGKVTEYRVKLKITFVLEE
jgi:flavin-binding protein dodecin